MRMIDKASGELGKTITHPLQSKVDEVIERELGLNPIKGDQISLTSFEKIRNKAYVRARLEERGFRQVKGSALKYAHQIVIDESAPGIPKFGKEDVLNRLKHGDLSSHGLKPSDKTKLYRTITYLRQTGYEIESEKKWSEKIGAKVLTYKLKTL